MFKKKRKSGADHTLKIVKNNPSFAYVEAYKALRTNLDFVSLGNQYHKIVITSAIPREGKSNVAINMAITLAETGKRVLLVDCDLRKPSIHRYLKIGHGSKGLTTILSKVCTFDEAVISFKDLDIDVLPAGALPPNPAEILGGQAMKSLLDELHTRYDYILLDTPPVSIVTDAAVLGRIVDGAIMVVRQKYAKVESAQLAKHNLESAGVRIIGAVLNGFDAKGTTKDTGYHYSYEYDYYKAKT